MSINGTVKNGNLFIFYGLLKRGALGMPDTIDLDSAGEFLGNCRFRANLYSLGTFPGVVAGDTLCHGMLYRLDRAEIAAALDAFEEVVADDPDASLYHRKRTIVMNDDGDETGQIAWIYIYNKPVDNASFIANGNWPLARTNRSTESRDT